MLSGFSARSCEKIESGHPRPCSDSESQLKTWVERALPRTLFAGRNHLSIFSQLPRSKGHEEGTANELQRHLIPVYESY